VRKKPAAGPRKWIRSVSKRREKANAEYSKQSKAFLKAHPVCQAPGCKAKSKDLHHSRGRAGRLLLAEEFWFALCRCHHDLCRDDIKAARELGIMCEAGQWGRQS